MAKKVILGLVVLLALGFLAIQFIPTGVGNPPAEPGQALEVPADVEPILAAACYDCHTNQTVWPWYSHVAPLSWWIADHVADGRRHLNFSEWASYPPEKADHKLEEIIASQQDKWMPLDSYVPMHPGADLTDEQRGKIIAWAKAERARLVPLLKKDGEAEAGHGQEGHDH